MCVCVVVAGLGSRGLRDSLIKINPYFLQELSVDSAFLARNERDSVSTGSREK